MIGARGLATRRVAVLPRFTLDVDAAWHLAGRHRYRLVKRCPLCRECDR